MVADTLAELHFPTVGVSNIIDVSAYPGVGCHRHTVQVLSAIGVTGLTYQVYGSLKRYTEQPVFPADFVDIGNGDTDFATYPVVHIYEKLVNTVVVQVTSLSGGAATLRYLGSR